MKLNCNRKQSYELDPNFSSSDVCSEPVTTRRATYSSSRRMHIAEFVSVARIVGHLYSQCIHQHIHTYEWCNDSHPRPTLPATLEAYKVSAQFLVSCHVQSFRNEIAFASQFPETANIRLSLMPPTVAVAATAASPGAVQNRVWIKDILIMPAYNARAVATYRNRKVAESSHPRLRAGWKATWNFDAY